MNIKYGYTVKRIKIKDNENIVDYFIVIKNLFCERRKNKMKVKELIEKLKGYEDFDIKFTVHKLLTEKELQGSLYPYPYENISAELTIDDIGHSDNVVRLGCEI